MKQHCVPGAQVAISVGPRPARSLAWGTAAIDTATLMRCETKFLVASLSKPVAALVCLELASQGKLAIDRPIGELVDPAWTESMHRGLSASTLRRLLMHTAEIPYFDSPVYGIDQSADIACRTLQFEQTTPEQLAEREASPEHSRTYTGRGYAILQCILERHLGESFEQLAESVLTDPLCANCKFSIEAACQPDLARDHCSQGKQLPQLWTPSLAASGLVCTAIDIANTLRFALRERHRPFIDALFVRPKGEEAPYTCGMHIWKDTEPRILDHGAARPGMRGVINVIPDANIVFVLLANSGHGVKVSRSFVGLVEQLGLARL